MNTKIMILISALFITFSVSGQTGKDVPADAKAAFSKKFSNVSDVKWSKESDKEWEAEFKMNGKEVSASYDNSGKWIETETELSSKELPAAVTASLKKDFAGYKTGEMSLIENPELIGYEIALKKGESAVEVIFNKTGTVLKRTDVKEEDEDSGKGKK